MRDTRCVNNGVLRCVQGGGTMRPYVGELMPLVVDALHDGGNGSDSKRRQVAVSTLGQLVESTG
jgi:FKBP12-rapamycin complex-associated protein